MMLLKILIPEHRSPQCLKILVLPHLKMSPTPVVEDNYDQMSVNLNLNIEPALVLEYP